MEEGLDAGSGNLTFKRVFERVEERTGTRITNASVTNRVWENQADFQADVLVSIARDEARPEVGGAVTAIAGLLGDLVTRPTGPDGQEQEWSLFAVGLEGLIQQFFEPDPALSPAPTGT